MLTDREREQLAQLLTEWPKGKSHLFMRDITHAGRAIQTPKAAIRAIQIKPDHVRKASPEVALAYWRIVLTEKGIERAFRDLCRYCEQYGQNYLDLLQEHPEVLVDLLRQKKRVALPERKSYDEQLTLPLEV